MNTIESPETRQYRKFAAVARSVVLLGAIAALAAIGAHSPERSQASLNCTYAAAPTGSVSDATMEYPGPCGTSLPQGSEPAVAATDFAVPDAASVLDPRAEPEPQPDTF